MGFQEAVTSVLSKYATFTGRARRSEYWFFYCFNALVAAVISVLGVFLGDTLTYVLTTLFSLAMFLPGLAVAVRRLHDIGRSAWSLLFALIPLVGWILLIVFFTQDSQQGPNQYGPNPKDPASIYP